MIVDKRAGGVDGELLPALDALRRLPTDRRASSSACATSSTRLSGPAARCADSRQLRHIERYYDEVWIYGERAIFDAVVEYYVSRRQWRA